MVDIFVVSDYCGNSEKKQKEKLEQATIRVGEITSKVNILNEMIQIKVDTTKTTSVQLTELHDKFKLLSDEKYKGAKLDPTIIKDDAIRKLEDKRFNRRIAYAFATVGIYAVVRGYKLGTFEFWKSQHKVLEEKINKVDKDLAPPLPPKPKNKG